MVPKSRQTESVSTEYLRQARIVWRELISIAKKLPKSRALSSGYDLRGHPQTMSESAPRCPQLHTVYR